MYCATRPLNNNTRHRPPTHNRHRRSHSSRSDSSSTGSAHQFTYSKPRKRSLPDDMAFFMLPNKINNQINHQFLAAPASLRSKRSANRFPNGDIDISSDLEISFASNISLNSPPTHNVSLASECEPMDISPAPPVKPPTLSTFERGGIKPARPRAFTSGARLFGADISNGGCQDKCLMPSPSVDDNPALGSVRSNSKKIQRSALPTEWLAPATSQVVQVVRIGFRMKCLVKGLLSYRAFLPLYTSRWTSTRRTMQTLCFCLPPILFFCLLFPTQLRRRSQDSINCSMILILQVPPSGRLWAISPRNNAVRYRPVLPDVQCESRHLP
jgi:hypothetical protein